MTAANRAVTTTVEQGSMPAGLGIRQAWEAIAPGYDEFVTPANMALGEEALRRVGLRAGMRFLDVAAGSGGLAVPAARLGARVLATDLSPAMVERLNARAREDGLTDLEARVMDGHSLELDDDSFDAAGSQFGVMLFPDLPRGLHELARVTKPGGCVLMVALGPPTRFEFLGFFLGALRATLPEFAGLPTDPLPLPFQVADPDELRRKMGDAGLKNVRVEPAVHRVRFDSGEHLWAMVTSSNPIGAELVADLSEEQKAAALRMLDGMLRERSGGGPAVLETEVNIGIGTK